MVLSLFPIQKFSTFELAIQTDYSEMGISLAAFGSSTAAVINNCAKRVYYHISGFKNGR
jgi:hypothetical protein